MLQEGLAKTAAEAEIIAAEKVEKAKLEEARIAANALEALEAASSLAPKDKMLARRKSETEEILEIKKIEEEQKQVQIDAKKAEEAALLAERDRQKLADTELLPNINYGQETKFKKRKYSGKMLKKHHLTEDIKKKDKGK